MLLAQKGTNINSCGLGPSATLRSESVSACSHSPSHSSLVAPGFWHAAHPLVPGEAAVGSSHVLGVVKQERCEGSRRDLVLGATQSICIP